jgi:DNA polymerase-3 subunit beta
MKFSCSTPDLLQSLQLVSRAIGSQQALPILGNILIKAEGKKCVVSATDLELSIITEFEANIESEGSVTVPAKAILNFAQYNTDPEVLLETVEGTTLKCASRSAKASIAGEAASEYPTIAAVEKQTTFMLPIGPLLRALHLVTFACARTTLRPVLSGVYLRNNRDTMILVATDSYRLSEYRIAAGITGDVACIIPVKILDELKVMLGGKREKSKDGDEGKKAKVKTDGEVTVILSKQQIELQYGSTRLLSRLIDGKFPNYEQILPKEATTTVRFSSAELATAVKRLHYFAKEVNNNLTFHCGKGQTRVVTPQTQAGKDEAVLTTEVATGESKIALSSSYLLDFLGHVDEDFIEMKVVDPTKPALFALPSEKDYLHLIMPLRMQEE